MPGCCPATHSISRLAIAFVLIPTSVAVGQGLPDQLNGYPTTHVIVHVATDVTPTLLDDGRWTFHLEQPGRINPQLLQNELDIAELLDGVGTESITQAFSPANAELAALHGLDRIYLVNTPVGTDTPSLVTALNQFDTHIELAELDGIGGIAATLPTDPNFDQQYGLYNTGQTILGWPGEPGADINVADAWDLTTGSSEVLLAVLDAGIDNHVDLAGRSIPGWNVVNDNDDVSDVCISHGTHVSGIAAANANNGTGIAGVDWNVTIVMVRVLNSCSGTETSAGAGLIWAANNNADVANLSLQYYAGTASFLNAVNYARDAGVVIVAAGGNFNTEIAYPAKWPETIAVAAFNNRGLRWTGSNQGPELSIAAPGEDVYSTINTNGYAYYDGTSMASPHVAGLACLMLSVDPSLTHDEIQSILIDTAIDMGAPGFDNDFGHGRIDAFAAIQRVQQLLADLDGDGVVGILDLLALLGQWGPCIDCPADFDGNDTVDILDLLQLLGAWG